ncbi:MAG: spore germination protein, partial [Bacillota bacterium]|nr:spore germination protein [Bacillota bacterium]
FSLFLSLTASSFYVMLVAFHQEMLPTALALRVAAGREGVPFPAVMEAIIMEFMFEIMREAGLRLPKPVGQAVSIVGTLVIGEAAVNAGLVGPTLVIAIAAAGVSSFAIPAYNTSFAIRLAKFPLIVLSGTFGILGFLGGTIALTMNLLSLRSFGAPFITPISPYRSRGNKDTIVRAPWWKMGKRPQMTKAQDEKRQKDNLEPKPPQTQ